MTAGDEPGPDRLAPRLRPPTAVRLGMITLAVLVLVGATGAYLALGYEADPARAHEVVLQRSEGLTGWTWGLHAWGGSALLVLVGLHAGRAWIRGRSKALTRRRWLTGIAALGIVVAAFFTGTILTWDQQGWEAMKHVQFGGEVLGLQLLDVEDPASAPLDVVFLFHVLSVPLLLVAILAAHLYRRAGARRFAERIGRLLRRGARDGTPLAVAVAGMAVAFPPLLGPAPFPRLAVTKPDWPFLWLIPVQQQLGSLGLWALPAAVAVAGVVPVLPVEWTRRRRLLLAGLAVATVTVLTILGAMA